jgi:hypothetical protein
MPDLRTSAALRQLTDLSLDPDPSEWAWAVVRLDLSGRFPDGWYGRVTSLRLMCRQAKLVRLWSSA